MNYRELQAELRNYKKQGLTEIRLNATKEELQAEYDRLTAPVKHEQSLDSKIKFKQGQIDCRRRWLNDVNHLTKEDIEAIRAEYNKFVREMGELLEQQEKEQKDKELRNELRTWENKEGLLFKRWKQAKDDNAPQTETDYLRSKMDECDDKIHQLCKALKELNKDEIERQAKEEHLLRIRKLVYLGNHEMKNNIPRDDLPVVGIFENNDKGYQNAMKVITNKYPNLDWEWLSDNSVFGGHFATFNNPKCEGDSILIV